MADNTVRGRFVWHELYTPNGDGAHEFYSKTAGWKTQGWEQDPSYRMFAAPTGPLGASVETRDGVPQWVPYIGTLDVDATVEAAKRLGAKVTKEPETLPNAGRYAVLTDPNGATFGVHGSPGEPRPETDPQEGEFCWHELATTVGPVDAFAFYKELFGWDDLGQHDMGSIGIYLLFGRNGKQLGGMFKKGDLGKPGPAYWVGYVRTKNVDKMADEVKAARGQVLNGPMAVPGGHRIAQFTDPHGAFFAGHTLAQDVQAAPATKAAASKPPKPAAAAQPAKPAVAAAPSPCPSRRRSPQRLRHRSRCLPHQPKPARAPRATKAGARKSSQDRKAREGRSRRRPPRRRRRKPRRKARRRKEQGRQEEDREKEVRQESRKESREEVRQEESREESETRGRKEAGEGAQEQEEDEQEEDQAPSLVRSARSPGRA